MIPEILTIPPSPEAAALIKAIDIPVSYYTGVPDISFPLYTLKGRILEVPIGLSYNSSGIKVEEQASAVGLGWSLLMGGQITRTTVGLADEIPYWGYYYSGSFNDGDFQPSIESGFYTFHPDDDFLYDVAEGELDTEPDQFYFNFLGNSGKFCFDGEGGIVTIPLQKLSIIPYISYDDIVSWKVTTSDGTQFFFGGTGSLDLMATKCYYQDNSVSLEKTHNTSWYLTKIISRNLADTLYFTYTNEDYTYQNPYSETIMWDFVSQTPILNGNSEAQISVVRTEHHIDGARIHTIKSAQGSVKVNYYGDRLDISDKGYIDNIKIFKQNDSLFKGFKFNYSYFISDGSSANNRKLRLRLDSIREFCNDKDTLPGYKFQYLSKQLPERWSRQKDHWGYYNGASLNDNLGHSIPSIDFGLSRVFDGADRETNHDYQDACIIQRITYPTGGYSEFVFEGNDYSFISSNSATKIVYADTIAIVESGTSNCNPYPNNNAPEIDTFLVSAGQYPTFDYYFCGAGPHHQTIVTIRDINGNLKWSKNFQYEYEGNGYVYSDGSVTTTYLSPGKYIIEAYASLSDIYAKLVVTFKKTYIQLNESSTTNALEGPGLRIKEIKYYDDVSTSESYKQLFQYTTQANPPVSSGVINFEPNYVVFLDISYNAANQPVYYPTYQANTAWARLHSSNLQTGFTKGSIVGYREAKVFEESNEDKGVTVYKYTSAYEYPDRTSSFFSYPLIENYDWKRGLLTEKIIFDAMGDTLRQELYIYNYIGDTINRKILRGFRSEFAWRGTLYSPALGLLCLTDLADFNYDSYKIVSSWHYPVSTIIKEYPSNEASPLISTRNYYFENPDHLQLTRELISTSKGDDHIILNKYPLDYPSLSPDPVSLAIKAMQNDSIYMHSIILESINKVENGFSDKIPSGLISTFLLNENKVLINRYFALGGELASEYDESTIDTAFRFDNDYDLILKVNSYDSYGHITETTLRDGSIIAYIWGYNQTQPVARIQGSHYSKSFYTSFEADGTVSSIAKTGDRVKSISTVNFQNLGFYPSETTTLKMSYWYCEDSKWKYSGELPYANQFTPVSTTIDELRVYEGGALMTTYTYEPPLGVTSITDPNGISTYYKYDTFGRLQYVLDQEMNILKYIGYNYGR